MAKIIAGIDDKSNLLHLCNDFGNLEINEKIVVIDSIEKFLFKRRNALNGISELLVSLILQCTAEKDPDIRSLAYRCVAYILQGPYKDIAEITINKAVFDPSNRVRIAILNVCANGYVPKDISDNLVKLLCKDANFSIRERATSME